MERKKLVSFILLTSLLVLVCTQEVGAVGIRGKTLKIYLDYSPSLVKVYNYQLLPTSVYTMDYEFYVRSRSGDPNLTQYISFEPDVLRNVRPGEIRPFNLIIKLPETEPAPGVHEVWAGVLETKTGTGGALGARAAVHVPIFIRVLYPGKYPKVGLSIPDANVGEIVPVTVKVENWGKTNISSAQATVYIYGPDNQTLDTLETDAKPVVSAGSAELHTTLDTLGYLPGDYRAKAIVDCDGNLTEARDTFRVGTLDVKVINWTGLFEKDGIKPLHIEVESAWNNPLKSVWAVVKIANQEMQTPTVSLEPWERKTLVTYFDTENVEAKAYDGSLTLYFDGANKTRIIGVTVYRTEAPLFTGTNLTILILVVIIIILAVLVYKNRRKKRRRR